MAKRYRVTLTVEEREALGGMISRGKAEARKLAHARVLLQADASEGGPEWTDTRIAEAARVSVRTIERVRQRFVEDGLEAALRPKPSARVYARKLDGEQEAKLVALACWGRPRASSAGRCGCWPNGWWNWRSCPNSATRRCARGSKNNALKPHLRRMGASRPSTRPRPRPAPGQALPDRVGDRATLERHVQAWQHRRNAAATRADWQFTTKDARIKLRKLYPTTEE